MRPQETDVPNLKVLTKKSLINAFYLSSVVPLENTFHAARIYLFSNLLMCVS